MNQHTPPRRARARIRRSHFVTACASAFASVAVVRTAGRAAEFTYKLGHPLPMDLPAAVRTVEMCNAIKQESNGRLEIQIFPNSQLGSATSMMTQLRAGALQFIELSLANASGIVEVGSVESVGFAFNDVAQFYKSMDGPLGAYLRAEFAQKGFYIFDRAFDLGARQIAAGPHPIRGLDDFAGFKLRTLTSPIVVDFFKTLGASPVPLESNELYTSLQSHLIDGCDFPLNSILGFRVWEVTKYISITNHQMQPIWLAANPEAWNALPSELQAIVQRNVDKYAAIERRDMMVSYDPILDKLRRLGKGVNIVDTAPMRAKLGPYYARCKAQLGDQCWSLLEAAVGKLG